MRDSSVNAKELGLNGGVEALLRCLNDEDDDELSKTAHGAIQHLDDIGLSQLLQIVEHNTAATARGGVGSGRERPGSRGRRRRQRRRQRWQRRRRRRRRRRCRRWRRRERRRRQLRGEEEMWEEEVHPDSVTPPTLRACARPRRRSRGGSSSRTKGCAGGRRAGGQRTVAQAARRPPRRRWRAGGRRRRRRRDRQRAGRHRDARPRAAGAQRHGLYRRCTSAVLTPSGLRALLGVYATRCRPASTSRRRTS